MNIKEVVDNFSEGQAVKVAGRVKFIRTFGKLSFIKIEDLDGVIQIGLQGKQILPEAWDIISVDGTTGFTKTKEPTIWTTSYELIAKCQGDKAEKFHGLQDKGLIYFTRCMGLISNMELVRVLLTRSQIVSKIRRFLEGKKFIEIETPVLSKQATGATAKPFITHCDSLGNDMYLRIATEIGLKKAIISGFERVFEIGKIFRNEGIDHTHNPEFTSIEIYQSYAGLKDMSILFAEIIENITGNKVDIPWFEYDELVAKHGIEFDDKLQQLCFVTGQPIEQTPLCKMRVDGKADRFEVYAEGFELANAYNEINTYEEQSGRMKDGEDDGLLEALKYGMPPTGGMGIGIDRLIMYLTNTKSIKDIIFLPL
jgi:lysyl-tRNA synthetase class 2